MDNFILPKKWCVKADSSKIVQKYFFNLKENIIIDLVSCDSYNSWYFHYPFYSYLDKVYPADISKNNDYIEITLNQFKQYVLKEPIEKDWTKASKDELLIEAQRRYPIGTIYKSVSLSSFDKECEIKKEIKYYLLSTNNIQLTDSNGGSIFCYGKWAEIISLPETKVETFEEKPQFEVSKWYYNSDKTFAKVSKITDNGFDYDEWILDGIYDYRPGWWGIHSNMKEATLEEIQQYLPDGHPDKFDSKILKIDDLIEGEYYQYIYSDYYLIGKCLKSKSSLASAINPKNYNFWINGSFGACNEFKLATSEEKKWLNICIYQNKFIDASELNKYFDYGGLINSLDKFPNEGYCKTDSIELRNYLKNKFPQYVQKSWNKKYSIIAWNNTGYWWCEGKSNKPEYTLKQLLPFITTKNDKINNKDFKSINSCSEVFLNQSIGRLDRSNISIFPIFEEKPLIQIKEFQINKNYFQNFKDPYIK